jgi:hypothetical protein
VDRGPPRPDRESSAPARRWSNRGRPAQYQGTLIMPPARQAFLELGDMARQRRRIAAALPSRSSTTRLQSIGVFPGATSVRPHGPLWAWAGRQPVHLRRRHPAAQEFHRSLEACIERDQVNGIRSLAGWAEPPLEPHSPTWISAPAGSGDRAHLRPRAEPEPRPKACFSPSGIGYRWRLRPSPDRARFEALARRPFK